MNHLVDKRQFDNITRLILVGRPASVPPNDLGNRRAEGRAKTRVRLTEMLDRQYEIERDSATFEVHRRVVLPLQKRADYIWLKCTWRIR
jgi:hypothetical protein